ncbi:hypothetical protein ONZ45_g4056 [Pleurotus djamor]|nr:hypothetical protein ONZ45_g4056 [Pleurotus djamor]
MASRKSFHFSSVVELALLLIAVVAMVIALNISMKAYIQAKTLEANLLTAISIGQGPQLPLPLQDFNQSLSTDSENGGFSDEDFHKAVSASCVAARVDRIEDAQAMTQHDKDLKLVDKVASMDLELKFETESKV